MVGWVVPPVPDRDSLVSFVLPAHNEGESLPILVEEIRDVAAKLGSRYEIVIVDDGSTDGTERWLRQEACASRDIRGIQLGSNRGQSTALARGLAASRGELVVTMDSDLQNVPADTIELLEALEHSDLACGVRAQRRDGRWKRLGARVANGVRRRVLDDDFRDVGCAHRAWRRPLTERLLRFEGFHRFVPLLARAEGFRVVEVPISHRPRRFGRTHYGNLRRALRGTYDLIGVGWFLRRRLEPPAEETEIA